MYLSKKVRKSNLGRQKKEKVKAEEERGEVLHVSVASDVTLSKKRVLLVHTVTEFLLTPLLLGACSFLCGGLCD